MTAHLLQIAIGPVQEFIAAARRTRDLWFGSYLLSEISKAAAREIQGQGGKLIFPDNEADLSPDKEEVTIANIIVAELPKGDPKTIADNAKKAAQMRWRDFADSVFTEYEGINGIIRDDSWEQEIGHGVRWTTRIAEIVEFYAAWVTLSPQNYAVQRKRLARLMAGRKNCRDFENGDGLDGVPKSSLDGLRETVFREGDRKQWPPKIRRRLRVRPGEQLDVVGLVKRTAEGHRPYPSVSRVAADPWLRGVACSDQGKKALADLRDACQALRNDDLLHGIKMERLHNAYKQFPFEGTAVYRSRHHEMVEDMGESEARLAGLRESLANVEAVAQRLKLGGEPDPYLAVLVADGDQMGKAIDAIAQLNDPGKHRDFSRELAQFAVDAERIVCEHHGVLIYSGGDDVLAFLPLDQALKCARALYVAFADTMFRALSGIDVNQPTLSVGVAIGHFLENLEDLFGYGRAAEKSAKKPNRNGLAVHLHKRGGAPVMVRKQWTEGLDEWLIQYAGWFHAKAVSNRTPYELERLATVYEDWPADSLVAAITSDAVRVIEKKRPGGEASEMKAIRAAVEGSVKNAGDLRELAAELLIARQLAVALRQSGGGQQ